jgi:pimeloyl-ACP methyl ester carboxylesterase
MISDRKPPSSQLLSTFGLLKYTALWVTAGMSDISISNPKFKKDNADDAGIAIYFVHGMGDRTSAFAVLVANLIADIDERISSLHVIAFDGRGQGKSISFFAKQTGEKIQKNNYKNVFLIGHSRGGIVVSHFAENFAENMGINVLGVFAICAPFGGTSLVWPVSLFSTAAKQMELDSIFLKNLCAKIKTSKAKYHFCTAEHDAVVASSATYVDESSQTIFERHGHLSIMFSKKLANFLRANITNIINAQKQPKEEARLFLKSKL